MHCYSPIIPPFQASGGKRARSKAAVGSRKRQKKNEKTYDKYDKPVRIEHTINTINPFTLKFVKGTRGFGLYGVPDGHVAGECYIGFSSGKQTVQLPDGEYIFTGKTFTMTDLKERMPSVFDNSRTIEIMDIKEVTAKDKFARDGDVKVTAKAGWKEPDGATPYDITVYMSKEMSEKMIRSP